MKTLMAIVLTVVLTASLLTGCGCTNRNMDNKTEPTVLPTNEEIWNTTTATTIPSTAATEPTLNTTHETLDNTTVSTDGTDNTTATTEDTMSNRARRMLPDMR